MKIIFTEPVSVKFDTMVQKFINIKALSIGVDCGCSRMEDSDSLDPSNAYIDEIILTLVNDEKINFFDASDKITIGIDNK